MPTPLEQATTARDNLLAKLVEYSVSPKPSYTIEGQQVNSSDYLKMLLDGVKAANEIMLYFDVYELRSVVT